MLHKLGNDSCILSFVCALLLSWNSAFASDGKQANVILDVKYFPRSLGAQSYEVEIRDDKVVVFTGLRNVKAQGQHSFKISSAQYDSVVHLLSEREIEKSGAQSSRYGYVADVTTRIDGIVKTTSIDAFTNYKAFLLLRNALEDILGLRTYRCPYYLSGSTPQVDVCAQTESQELRMLKGE
jgi:hypothetical protein